MGEGPARPGTQPTPRSTLPGRDGDDDREGLAQGLTSTAGGLHGEHAIKHGVHLLKTVDAAAESAMLRPGSQFILAIRSNTGDTIPFDTGTIYEVA